MYTAYLKQKIDVSIYTISENAISREMISKLTFDHQGSRVMLTSTDQ